MRRAIGTLAVFLFLLSVTMPIIVQADFADDFVIQWSEDLGTDTLGISFGDTDNDGIENELITVTRDNVYILKGDKTSSSYNIVWSTTIDAQNSPVWKSVVVEDADNDGLNEIAIVATGLTIGGIERCAFIYEWNGTTYVLHSTTPPAGRSIDSIAVGDVDQDGKNEVVVGTTDGYYYGHIRVFEWDNISETYIEEWSYGDPVTSGYGSDFDPPYSFNKIYANVVCIGNSDNDDRNEIVAGDYFGDIFVFKWNDNTATFDEQWITRRPEYGWHAYGLAVNDVNNDGDTEIVVGADNRIASLKLNASETYEELNQISIGSNMQWYGIVIGDVDHDGANELIAGNVDGQVYCLEWNTELGEYVEEWIEDIGTNAWKIAIGDFDNDRYNEFVVGNAEGEVIVYDYITTQEPTASPVRVTPPPQNALASIAVGAGISIGFTFLMSLSGFAQSFNSVISRLPIPTWLLDFVSFYAEESFKSLSEKDIKNRKRRFITWKELVSLLFAISILLVVFTYVEVNGLPKFADVSFLLATVPSVLLSVVMIFLVSQLLENVTAVKLNVWSEFRIWIYGLVALIITSILFFVPFASPGKMEYQGAIDTRKAGLIASIIVLSSFMFCLPFSLFHWFGFPTLADAGLMLSLMTAFYSSFPFKPLEGKVIFHYNSQLWLLTFLTSFTLFLCVTLKALPQIAFLIVGIIATVLFIVLLRSLKTQF
jgi:hypothetical protein